MRIPLTILSTLMLLLGLAACDDAPDAEAPRSAAAAEAEPAPVKARRLALSSPELTDADVATYLRVMTPLMEARDSERYEAEKKLVENWLEIEIKVGRAMLEYDAMLDQGIEPNVSEAVRARYDALLLKLHAWRDRK